MTDSSHVQPKEIERIACSKCGGFLRLETAMRGSVGHPRYDMMRCITCDVIHCVVDEKRLAGLVSRAAQALTTLRATHRCSLCWPSQTILSRRPILSH
jgi:hypothetical protein